MAFYDSLDNTSNLAISFTANPRLDFATFARGYFRAASALADHVLAKQSFADYEAYPIVFLYRHSFELYLKGLLYTAAILSAFKDVKGIDQCFYDNHRLLPLAQSLAQVFRILFPSDESLARTVTKAVWIASEFSEIDFDSYSYRYPIDKRGNASTKHHQVVNLRAFHKTMQELLRDMDILDFGMDIEISKSQEIYEVLQEAQRILFGQG